MKRRDFAKSLLAAPLLFDRRLRSGREIQVERWSWAMGQPVHVVVFAGSEAEGLETCAAALEELRAVDAALSLFDDSSDLCELNRRAGGRPMRAGTHLLEFLRRARRACRQTDGAFNAALEPLMRAWGFHRPRHSAPSAAELQHALRAVRAAAIRIEGDMVSLSGGEARLDPGGIGVGYGLDRMLDVLVSHGIRRAFIDISGDCAALDPPPGEDGWLVGIADPDRMGSVLETVSLANGALATSGNDVSAVVYGPIRAGHILDPESGQPARRMRQVTVQAATAWQADSFSTAMFVSGRRPRGALRVRAVPLLPEETTIRPPGEMCGSGPGQRPVPGAAR